MTVFYKSKNELRITRFGRDFPWLKPVNTGALFVLTRQDSDRYCGYFLLTEDEINQFLGAFGIGATEVNRLIDTKVLSPDSRERKEIAEFIRTLSGSFPSSEVMSAAAREIQNRVFNHVEYIQTDPDRKIIDWTNTEFVLFRAVEEAFCGQKISGGFSSVDEFISFANGMLNRRKSRAGKSLEHHLAALFDGNGISYSAQAITEGRKKPDFLFPSQEAYHDFSFPEDRLISLAAKTTCKDRWRQILNEADRLRDRPKYICTLQQGISPGQMDEMQQENVILVVPRPFIRSYPEDRRERIWTLSKFLAFVREKTGV